MTIQTRFSNVTNALISYAEKNNHTGVLQPVHIVQSLLMTGGEIDDLITRLFDRLEIEKSVAKINTENYKKYQRFSRHHDTIYTPSLVRIIELAWNVSAKVNSQFIEPEHLLIGIVQEKQDDAFSLIKKYWINSDKSQSAISLDTDKRLLFDIYITLGDLKDHKGEDDPAKAYFTLAYDLDPFSNEIPSEYVTLIQRKKENKTQQERSNRHDQYNLVDESEVVEDVGLTFDAVAGIDDPSSEYYKLRRFFELIFLYPSQYKELAEEYGILSTNSILLFGPTGVGKTYVSKAIAGEFRKRTGERITFINAKLSSIMDKWVGNTEKNISKLIQIAFDREPSLLLLDEIDSLGMTRHSGSQRDYRIDWVNHLLMELDRVKSSRKRILVIGCTNAVSFVDPAIRRRLGNPIVVPLPDLKLRKEVFKVHISQVSSSVLDEIDYSVLAQAAEGFTPADIEVVVRATISRVWLQIIDQITSENKPRTNPKIGTEEFLTTLRSATPTVSVEQWVQETVDALRESHDDTLAERVEEVFQGYYQPETLAGGHLSFDRYSKRKWYTKKEPPPYHQ